LLKQAFIAAAMGATALAASAASPAFDPSPWLADLEQARQAFHQKYANWDWAENEHGVKIDALFDQSADRLRHASDGQGARAVFDRIPAKLGDGHVEFDWPEPAASTSAGDHRPAPDVCAQLGYDARQNSPGPGQSLSRFAPLRDEANPFAAGTALVGKVKLGILRIGVFQPQGYPDLCRTAARELSVPAGKPCDDSCSDRIATRAYEHLTAKLEERLRQLRTAGASVLLVDITDNGGGSEWAEAVARTLTRKLLVSERRGFVRGEHWVKLWGDLADRLRSFAATAPSADRLQLLGWAKEADAARVQAQTPCAMTSASCERIAKAGFSTGLIGSARSGAFAARQWGPDVFSPAQYHYHEGVWSGPLIILVDQETWSAAEEFAAVLQDNKAAIVLGARTGGAGCGHTNGGTPTTLKNSGAVLKLPDCVRFRADGSNEVRGIIPDELVAIRPDDGLAFRARLIAEQLPAAIARAKKLQAHGRRAP
jgi:Peptidase family S41